ncbi:hypothetical protein [Macrococcus sp. DPC7161]|uniref:hypothetical protein n=1 Tax=Macrococcus sp. DPC7161 TaxID=2507060 RepID=UPI00100B82E6|nr:hypothetical protein [Macrococcus sp. DPC7161]RXK18354.1 hypothetical protein ER639_06595 [Macrococcus sp. DPC7161]
MEIQIDKDINDGTESTSTVSSISYPLENALYSGNSTRKIYDYLNDLKDEKKFPKNLTFIDAHLDEATGMSAVAFIDEETGKEIVGFTVTNLDTGNIYGVKDDEK